jgi:hypothetical protein
VDQEFHLIFNLQQQPHMRGGAFSRFAASVLYSVRRDGPKGLPEKFLSNFFQKVGRRQELRRKKNVIS